jgi:hypothetical protein
MLSSDREERFMDSEARFKVFGSFRTKSSLLGYLESLSPGLLSTGYKLRCFRHISALRSN